MIKIKSGIKMLRILEHNILFFSNAWIVDGKPLRQWFLLEGPTKSRAGQVIFNYKVLDKLLRKNFVRIDGSYRIITNLGKQAIKNYDRNFKILLGISGILIPVIFAIIK